MLATYVSAALLCAAALLVGRALLTLAGRPSWSWTEPAVGIAAVLAVTGALARAPGHATSAALGVALLLVASVAVCLRRQSEAAGALRAGLPAAIATAVALSIPFAMSGRWGPLGVGVNNDLGLHLAWAEWLRSGVGPTPEAGYPLGPHALADAIAAVPGIGLAQAFVGELLAIGVLTALTALGALRGLSPGRRTFAATIVAVPYLGASYFAQGAFKETLEALFVLAFAVDLATLDRRTRSLSRYTGQTASSAWGALRGALPFVALAAGIFFSYSFAGLAWPIAIVAFWSVTRAEVRRALAPRRLLRLVFRPATLLVVAIVAGLAAVTTLVGPFGFVHGFNKVAGSNTYGPVSPIEAIGIWPASNYRLDAPGGAHLTGLAGAVAVLALLLGFAWWVRRRELAVPAALAACAAVFLLSLPFSGEYSQAKALMIAAPLAMLVIARPLLAELPGPGRRRDDRSRIARPIVPSAGLARAGWAALAVAFFAGAVYSSFLVLRDASVGPPGHGSELRAFLPILHGKPVLYAGQDRYAAYELLGADTHVPLVEFPDAEVSPNPEKPFDTGDAYSPIDFDSFSIGTLARFPYVITGRAAWNSAPPPQFHRIATTPSYILWENEGGLPPRRHVLLEGTEAGARADCVSPEIRILAANPGRAGLFPETVVGRKPDWREASILRSGESASMRMRLPAGEWNLSLQYFSPFSLTLRAPGFSETVPAALDGQRPNTISLANNGQFWPAGRLHSDGGTVDLTVDAAEPSSLQKLSGYSGKAYLGELVATRRGGDRTVPLRDSCGDWIDWFESDEWP